MEVRGFFRKFFNGKEEQETKEKTEPKGATDMLQISLKSYILSQRNTFYLGLPERIALATSFLDAYNEYYQRGLNEARLDKLGNPREGVYTPRYTPALSLDTIVVGQSDSATNVFDVIDLPSEDNPAFSPKNPIGSPDYVSPELLALKKLAFNSQLYKYYSDTHSIYTVASLLFTIIFCSHPHKGVDYYSKLQRTAEEEFSFFASAEFIFTSSKNKLINGFHDDAHTIWRELSLEQREFFTQAFSRGYVSFDRFYKTFKEAFSMSQSFITTACGTQIPVVCLGENLPIILTKSYALRGALRCRRCMPNYKKKCDACPLLKSNNDILRLLSVEAQVLEGETFIKTIQLFSGRDVWEGDIVGENAAIKKLFNVEASKNNEILGLRYLQEKPLIACGQDGTKRIFEKDKVIPMLGGTRILLSDKYMLSIPQKK